MRKRITSIIIAGLFLLGAIGTVSAQDANAYPIYIVQPGENLTEIAARFGVSVNELINANNIINSNLISAGTRLIIPGIEGISGILTTTPVAFGDTLTSILRRNALSRENFRKLNDITSPSELYVGANLVLPQADEATAFNNSVTLESAGSMLEEALLSGQNPWLLAKTNQLANLQALPGEILYFFSSQRSAFHSTFSDQISRIELNPLPLVQGHTTALRVYSDNPVSLSGSLGSYTLNFFRDDPAGYYYALQGVHALAQPGLLPVKISGQFEDGESFSLEQMVLLQSGNYPNEELSVEQTTIEQSIVETENEQVKLILAPITPEKFWVDRFNFPVDGSPSDNTMAFSSLFGSRRSYNQGQHFGYHGGLDFRVVVVSYNIYAPAAGTIAYTGTMEVRGNTIFIDHGQGIYSGYAHMREFNVNAGDRVEKGQLIGLLGDTGRVTGPHLHWDIWVNGIPVDPFDWTDNVYP